MTQTEKLIERLAQAYCLPKHSHKVLDPELLEDFITAIKEWALEMVGKDEEIIPERKALANLHTRSYNQRAKEIRDRINE